MTNDQGKGSLKKQVWTFSTRGRGRDGGHTKSTLVEKFGCAKNKIFQNKPKGLEVAKEDQIAHMPYG